MFSQHGVDLIAAAVVDELYRAFELHGEFPSLHHAASVLREEHDELWEEIKKKNPDHVAICKEAIQLGAMTIRLIYDLLSVSDLKEATKGRPTENLRKLLWEALPYVRHDIEGMDKPPEGHICGPDAGCDGTCVGLSRATDVYFRIKKALKGCDYAADSK